MEVYEVMLFAIPLWMGMIVFFFTLIFGRDFMAYLASNGASQKSGVKPEQSSADAPVPMVTSVYRGEPARTGQRKLVTH